MEDREVCIRLWRLHTSRRVHQECIMHQSRDRPPRIGLASHYPTVNVIIDVQRDSHEEEHIKDSYFRRVVEDWRAPSLKRAL